VEYEDNETGRPPPSSKNDNTAELTRPIRITTTGGLGSSVPSGAMIASSTLATARRVVRRIATRAQSCRGEIAASIDIDPTTLEP